MFVRTDKGRDPYCSFIFLKEGNKKVNLIRIGFLKTRVWMGGFCNKFPRKRPHFYGCNKYKNEFLTTASLHHLSDHNLSNYPIGNTP